MHIKINKITQGILAALLYVSLAYATTNYFSNNGLISLIWLPCGLAVAMLLILGKKFWPAVAAAGMVSSSIIFHHPIIGICLGVGATVEALVASELIRQNRAFPLNNSSLRGYVSFLIIIAASSLLSASIGVFVLNYYSLVANDTLILNLLHWWQGNFLGMLFFTPLLIVSLLNSERSINKNNALEYICLISITIAGSISMFFILTDHLKTFYQYGYLIFPIMIWASLRFGLFGCLTILTLLSAVGMAFFSYEVGVSSTMILRQNLAHFWLFFSTLCVVGYAISVTMQHVKSVRQAFLESEERLSLTLDATNQGLYDLNVETGDTYINDAYGRMFGYEPGELVETNQKWIERLHPDDRERVAQYYQDYVSGKFSDYCVEFRMLTKQNTYVWVQSVCAIVSMNNDGLPTRMVGTHLNITERKLAQEKLAKIQERYTAALELSNIGMYDFNLVTNEINVNAVYANMLGYSSEGFVETVKSWSERIHPQDREQAIRLIKEYIVGRITHFRAEYRMLNKQNEWVWLLSSGAIIQRDSQGKPLHMVGTHVDITELKKLFIQSQENAKRYKVLLDNLPLCIYEINLDGEINSINTNGLEMLGINGDENIIGSKYIDIIHEDDKDRVDEILQKAKQGQAAFFEVSNHDKTKRYTTCFVPLFSSKGNISFIMGYSEDVTEKRSIEDKVWQQANYDDLTQLPNRNNLTNMLENKLNYALHEEQHFALMFIDLDQFKEVNDSLGHPVGDALLIEVAQRVQQCLPDNSLLARQGGDEFCALIFDDPKPSYLDMIAQQIINVMNMPFKINNEILFVTASIGIALSHHVKNVSELLKFADLSLHEAKAKGKNQFCHFKFTMQEAFNLKNKLNRELRKAITNREFELYYQPIVNVNSGEVEKAEVLIRWNHPDMGLLTPDKFISIAEETGQIIDIGYYVMEEAFKKLSQWRDKFDKLIQLSINKSPIEIYNSKRAFIEDCFFLLDKYNISSDVVNIEITENVLLETPDEVVDTMLSLKNANIEISLDDFGTGYSSLAYLNRLDIDYLKIDKRFVDNITTNNEDMLICKAMINIAHTLGLSVVAEGIESQQQLQALSELCCDYAQGYLFSKPVNADVFENSYINKKVSLVGK